MVPVPPPRVELPSAASVGDASGWGGREVQVVNDSQSPPQAQQPQWVSNQDLGATNLPPAPPQCHRSTGQLQRPCWGTQHNPEIPRSHLTSLLRVWDLGLEDWPG